jgi:hypothetical protein
MHITPTTQLITCFDYIFKLLLNERRIISFRLVDLEEHKCITESVSAHGTDYKF